MAYTINHYITDWVEESRALMQPDKVLWIDGTETQLEELRREAYITGELIKLNQEKLPGCVYHRSALNDVARVEGRTFICCKKEEDAGPTNNWMAPDEMKAKLHDIYAGCMRGRTMYVIPYSMGAIGSPFAKYGIEITDNVVVETTMQRIYQTMYGYNQLQTVADIASTDFTSGLTSKLAAAPITRQLILHETDNSEDAALTNHLLMSFPESARLLNLTDLEAEEEESGDEELEPVKADSYPIAGMAYANQYAYDNTGDYPEKVETNVLVCGSEGMLGLLSSSTYANESLLLQSINGISGNEDAVTVSTLSLAQDTLEFTPLTFLILFIVFVIAVPVILLVICLVVFLKRRHL